jgi:hypothetical protein
MSARAMVRLFESMGIAAREMVALAGVRTVVGFSHCGLRREFVGRLYYGLCGPVPHPNGPAHSVLHGNPQFTEYYRQDPPGSR